MQGILASCFYKVHHCNILVVFGGRTVDVISGGRSLVVAASLMRGVDVVRSGGDDAVCRQHNCTVIKLIALGHGS